MARKIQLFTQEWKVYLDDIEREIEIPDPDEEGATMLETKKLCTAVEIDDEHPEPNGDSTFNLRAILLPDTLKLGHLARKGAHDEAVYMLLRKSLVGWNNVGGGEKFTRKNIDFLPMEEASALASFIMDKLAGEGSKTSRKEGRDLGNS